jgi:SAM-dependent methyltransferase
MEAIRKYLAALKHILIAAPVLLTLLGVIHFPYDVDAPLTQQEIAAAQKYYADAYRAPVTEGPTTEYETKYLRLAEVAAKALRIEEQVAAFAREFNLSSRKILEIGSGRGYLQDVVENYTGLDISTSVARFYHKKFVLGSATALPFPDDSFDGVWSIWVFEHVPNPEQAFREARRVTRDNGVIFLLPAWNCVSWAAEGYEPRPYADFDLAGKLIKASLIMRADPAFRIASLLPIRAVRTLTAQFGPTRLRYRRLTPNYEKYWVPDSDAVNSIDRQEAKLWFLSRGDECVDCAGALSDFSSALIIRVHKSRPVRQS